MNYKVDFKTKTMEWKTKYNALVNIIDPDNLLKPVLVENVKIANYESLSKNAAVFNVGTNIKGVYMFTYGYCMVLIPIYNPTENTVYRIASAIVDSGGNYSVKILSYFYSSGKIVIFNNENLLPANWDAYLFRIKLN